VSSAPNYAQGSVQKVLEVLEGVEERANGFWALCPAHDDHDPSLHIEEKEGGQVVYICRAGCGQQQVTAALEQRGLKKRDLFDSDTEGRVLVQDGLLVQSPFGAKPVEDEV
jgi:DNA primase